MSNQRWRIPGSPVLITVLDAGLACCALEFHAAIGAGLLEPAGETGPAANRSEDDVNVLVVTGTVTDVLAPAVVAAFEALPEPRRCVSFGACSNTGGPYWDSYSVLKGIDQLIPVDVYVPGCPPRPEALVEGLELLVRD